MPCDESSRRALDLQESGLQVRDHDVKAEERREKGPVFFGGKTDLDILAAQQGVSRCEATSTACWVTSGPRKGVLTSSLPPYENGVVKGTIRATPDGQRSDGYRRGVIPLQA